MIRVTKFDGTAVMINPDWIQTIENTPDTVITLTNGVKIIVQDSVEAVVSAFQGLKRASQKEAA